MSTSTFATVVVPAADQPLAQTDFPSMFTAGFCSPEAEDKSVATSYVSSGWFFDSELDQIVNEVTWPKIVKFGDAQAALASLGLVPVLVPVEQVQPTE